MARQAWEDWHGLELDECVVDSVAVASDSVDARPMSDEEAIERTRAWADKLPGIRATMVEEHRIPTDRELQMGTTATGQAVRVM
jgi:hypothetical protein